MTGAKLRDYHLVRALGTRAELTYIFFQQPGAPAPTAADLPFCRRILPIPAPKFYSPTKLAKGLMGQWPVTVENYTSPAMIEAARAALLREQFDMLHVDIINLAACEAALRPHLKSIPVFYNWHNIESELMLRFSEQATGPKKFYAGVTARRLQEAEDGILRTASGHVVCSEREKKILLDRQPKARIEVIENGVDTTAFLPNEPNSHRPRLLFVGSMNYHANIEGALWFTRSIWPSIRDKFPELTLTLVGAEPDPSVLALRSEPRVEVTGTVPDVRPYYRDAFAAIVPLRSGSGTRLKILEAMAAGVPVVSTALGAEGLPVTPGQDFLLAEEVSEWQNAFHNLQDAGRWNEIVTAAKAYVIRHDWETLGEKLFATYTRWMKRR